MIDVTQKGYNNAYNSKGEFLSKHSTYRVALEKVINSGGGHIVQPIIEVRMKDLTPPKTGVLNSVTWNI